MERPPFPKSSVFRIRLNTFRDLWRSGYYLTCGLKFGCDYLAYQSAPGEVSLCAVFLFCTLFSEVGSYLILLSDDIFLTPITFYFLIDKCIFFLISYFSRIIPSG